MKIQARSATSLLILSAVVAACGGASATSLAATQGQGPTRANAPAQASVPADSSAGTGSIAAINACALITEQEATAFLGSDPGPGQDTGTAESPACAYDASLTIGVDLNGGKVKFDSDTASMQGSANSHTLSGVGDAGAVTIVGNAIAAIEILKGSMVLSVNVQGSQPITLAALTALGTTAVGRL
jgi:hypothetical protein